MCRFGLGGFGPGSFRHNLDSNFVFYFLFINLYHYGRVGQYECVRIVRGGFRVWRDVVGWDMLGRYIQGMVVYLPWVR